MAETEFHARMEVTKRRQVLLAVMLVASWAF